MTTKTAKEIFEERWMEHTREIERQTEVLKQGLTNLVRNFLKDKLIDIIDSAVKFNKPTLEIFFYFRHAPHGTEIAVDFGRFGSQSITKDVENTLIESSGLLTNFPKEIITGVFQEVFTGCIVEYIPNYEEPKPGSYKFYTVKIHFK